MAMSLNHFSIRSLDLDACERFYCGLLGLTKGCLLYTSDAADERSSVDLGGRRIIKQKKRPRLLDRSGARGALAASRCLASDAPPGRFIKHS